MQECPKEVSKLRSSDILEFVPLTGRLGPSGLLEQVREEGGLLKRWFRQSKQDVLHLHAIYELSGSMLQTRLRTMRT